VPIRLIRGQKIGVSFSLFFKARWYKPPKHHILGGASCPNALRLDGFIPKPAL
jgi:hypothetical protein